MKPKVTFEFDNPHELARLLTLIEDGRRILANQGRTQRGIDGYTSSDLAKWDKAISESTSIRCKCVSENID